MEQIWLTLFGLATIVVSIFLILLILVQRGRGGGLTGALGGMGGQSAFGSKAGDVFTRITVVTATIWILLSTVMIAMFNRPIREFEDQAGPAGAFSGIGELAPLTEDGDAAPDEAGQLPGESPGAESQQSEESSESLQTDAPPIEQSEKAESADGDQSGDEHQAGDGEQGTDEAGGG